MPSQNYDPQAQRKVKTMSNEQRFGHVNSTNRNSYLNIIFMKLVTEKVKKKIKNVKFGLLRF